MEWVVWEGTGVDEQGVRKIVGGETKKGVVSLVSSSREGGRSLLRLWATKRMSAAASMEKKKK